ncbi:hypothetical protein HYFRA_00000899 [Hymenoscyphus fraxineus]|uniref:Uncharacterized protein n=1 Tax=Hymenoscyphus fraxineus TaxID=746836 RepID=A0A9N9PQJ7_9HELO|nr:hypothetical protein HYFRA_00000899 [Hymenoscyphus fraxineus]
MMASFTGRDIPAAANSAQKQEEKPKPKHLSPRSSADYPSSKATSSKTPISKRSSNPSSSASDTQGNNRADNLLQHVLSGIGSQFRDSSRAQTIRDEIEISSNTDGPGIGDLHGRERQQQRTRVAVPISRHANILNDRMRVYLESQDDPSQQYALFPRSDTGQLSTQKGKKSV